MLGQHGGHGLFDRVFLPEVTHLQAGQAAVLCNLAGYRLQLVEFAAHQHHPGPQGGQLVRGTAADAGAPAGDDHHPAGEQIWGKYRGISHPISFKSRRWQNQEIATI